MAYPRNHNGGPPLGPPQPTLAETAQRLRDEIRRLHGIVEHIAHGEGRRRLGSTAMATSWAPSRLRLSKTKRDQLRALRAARYEIELEPRAKQIAWLQRKLARVEAMQGRAAE